MPHLKVKKILPTQTNFLEHVTPNTFFILKTNIQGTLIERLSTFKYICSYYFGNVTLGKCQFTVLKITDLS